MYQAKLTKAGHEAQYRLYLDVMIVRKAQINRFKQVMQTTLNNADGVLSVCGGGDSLAPLASDMFGKKAAKRKRHRISSSDSSRNKVTFASDADSSSDSSDSSCESSS